MSDDDDETGELKTQWRAHAVVLGVLAVGWAALALALASQRGGWITLDLTGAIALAALAQALAATGLVALFRSSSLLGLAVAHGLGFGLMVLGFLLVVAAQ
jgi:hypothetical protein